MSSSSSNQTLAPAIKFFFARIFPTCFAIPGAVILFFGIRSYNNAKESISWPQVAGHIVSSEVNQSHEKDGITYRADVLYDFDVNGVTYSSNEVAFGSLGRSKSSYAQQVVNRYPKGKDVTVSYKPDAPETSVLEPGVQSQVYFLPLFGLVFLGIGCLLLFFLPKIMRKQEEQTKDVMEPIELDDRGISLSDRGE